MAEFISLRAALLSQNSPPPLCSDALVAGASQATAGCPLQSRNSVVLATPHSSHCAVTIGLGTIVVRKGIRVGVVPKLGG